MTQAAQGLANETISIGAQFLAHLREVWEHLGRNAGNYLWNLLMVVVILFLARLTLTLVSRATRHAMNREKYHRTERQGKRVDTMMTLLRSVARYVIYFIALLMILYQLGLGAPITNLMVTAGIGSLAIGFGAQNLVRDVVTGFFMMFENQFSVGDYIKTDEAEGTVQATAMRVTYLRSLKGDQIIVPNGTITRVVNYTRGGYVASITISTAYEADTRQVMAVIGRAVREYAAGHADLVEEEPVVLGITSLGESSVDIGVSCKVKPMKQWEVERGMRLAVKEQFDLIGVEFPYPHLVAVPYKEPVKTVLQVAGEPLERGETPDWANSSEVDDE